MPADFLWKVTTRPDSLNSESRISSFKTTTLVPRAAFCVAFIISCGTHRRNSAAWWRVRYSMWRWTYGSALRPLESGPACFFLRRRATKSTFRGIRSWFCHPFPIGPILVQMQRLLRSVRRIRRALERPGPEDCVGDCGSSALRKGQTASAPGGILEWAAPLSECDA